MVEGTHRGTAIGYNGKIRKVFPNLPFPKDKPLKPIILIARSLSLIHCDSAP
jgi:hypothetical protein